MLWSDQKVLQRCQELRQLGLEPSFTAGERVGRGFADLGFEEFLLLSERTLLSLVNGKTSELPEEHRQFFFAVPTIEQLLDFLDRREWDVLALEFEERRTWRLRMRAAEHGEERMFCGDSLYTTLLEGVAYALIAHPLRSI